MLANGCYECLRPWSRARYAAHLGVSAEALELLRVGHSTCEMLERDTLHRWSYPMASPGAECCGIQLRSWDHGKKAIGGSKLGLFRPLNFEPARPFLICEGASDTAAAITLRFNAIGRASAKSTAAAVQEIVRTSRTPAVCIVADADEVGLGGAHQLGDMLLRYCEVRIAPAKISARGCSRMPRRTT